MKWTTPQAFEKVKEAGLTDNYYRFMKWVREGRLPAELTAKKSGYRFQEQDVLTFIEQYQKDDTYSLTEEMNRLRAENEAWSKKWTMPRDYWVRENAELKKRLQDAEQEVADLKKQLEDLIDDKTIRIRVE